MTLEDFSGGYYSLDMHIQPYSEGPVIASTVYDYINREVYSSTDAPVTMKLSLDNGAYFNVGAENAVPSDVLAVPKPWVEQMGVNEDGRVKKVFVLKPGHSYLMHQRQLDAHKFEDTDLEDFTDD